MQTTFWLEYEGVIMGSVLCSADYSDNAVRGAAVAYYERNRLPHGTTPNGMTGAEHLEALRYSTVLR